MNSTIKWLHVSDFHFGKNEFDQKFTCRKIIEHITEKKQKGDRLDLVFVTGDIANSAKAIEYKSFTEEFITPLTDLFGIDFLDRIFVVPGNHDLNREVNDGFSKEKFAKPDSDYFYPTEKSNGKRRMLIDRFESFCNEIPLDHVKDFKKESGAYSFNIKIDSLEIGITGINTAWLCDGNDRSLLTPGIQITRSAIEKTKKLPIKFVLGHHPLDWFHHEHTSTLHAIFADHGVIYLHGHMHAEGLNNIVNGSGEFLSLQAGASWQAPEGGKWKNGFMWGEFDISSQKIRLEPFHWNFENQCWTLNGSRFHESLREGGMWVVAAPRSKSNAKVDYKPREKHAALVGWDIKDIQLLELCTAELNPQDAISYFDGATPSWNIALSDSIPRREIVKKLAAHFTITNNSSSVCALLGAGCEGKSTVLLQACYEILRKNPSKKLIFRTNHTRSFKPSELAYTLSTHDNWLIVIDEADQVAKDVLRFIDLDFEGYEGKIDFILASRDSDWRTSGANELPWTFKAKYKEVILKDLSPYDADAIVSAWAKFGSQGLGEELSNLPERERADKLRFYAKKEAKGNSDAFFGALLMCRHGGDLLEHAELMLNRLAAVDLDCGKNLKDVLGYIAAMHSEGFSNLSFSALAALLDMTVPKLQSEVIRRLGKEAAATSTSSNVFTRHKYIATAIVEVLETKFNEDISHYFVDLAVSESRRAKIESVLDLTFWRYELSDKLFAIGKERLATDITQELLNADPSNYHLLTKLASFYRKQDGARQAIDLFRDFPIPPKHRGFYFEWGVCEGAMRNFGEQAILAIYALCDDSEESSLTVDQARMYLSGLAMSCDKLYSTFADPLFNRAHDAAFSMLSLVCLNLSDEVRKNKYALDKFHLAVKKKQRKLYTRSESLRVIKEINSTIQKYGVTSAVKFCQFESITFEYLDRLARNIAGDEAH